MSNKIDDDDDDEDYYYDDDDDDDDDVDRMMEELTYLTPGLEIKIFSREPNCIFRSHLQLLCIETSTFLGSLQKFEGAAGEFKGVLSSRHPFNFEP